MAYREDKGRSLIDNISDYVVFDLETTGLDPSADRIIQIGALKVSNRQVVDSFNELVNPETEISEFITGLTGISNKDVADCETIEDVLPRFLAFVGNSVMVAHNANFDINFIYDNCMECMGCGFPNDFVDTMRVCRLVVKGLPTYKLSYLVEYFSLEGSNTHRADDDCMCTYELYERLKDTAQDKGIRLVYRRFIKSTDIHSTRTSYDEEHPFFGKTCLFTGTLTGYTRAEAMQIIADCGGINANAVTKKVNYLIVGNFDYRSCVTGEKSTKLMKVEEYVLKGLDIQIISEDVFTDILNGYKEEKKEYGEQLTFDSTPEVPSNFDSILKAIENHVETICERHTFESTVLQAKKSTSPTTPFLFSIMVDGKSVGKFDVKKLRVIVRNDFAKFVDANVFVSSAQDKTSTGYTRFDIKTPTSFVAITRDYYSYAIEHYLTPPPFGCCGKYKECSEAKECLHSDQLHALGCLYRQNFISKGVTLY